VPAKVVSVSSHAVHAFSKKPVDKIKLVENLGVAGDAHAGVTVKHRSRVARDLTQPNLRQVHLLQAELLDSLAANGFAVGAGDIGENILTRGVDLLALSTGTLLNVGASAIIQITGLRNPCQQLNNFQSGLTTAVLETDADGNLVRKAGVMGIVLAGGEVSAGDAIIVHEPVLHVSLLPV
jgi:MOSC domain-containing protein YiiM